MKVEQLKKLSIQIMIGSLIVAAVLAVIAVLKGNVDDVLARALFTLGLVAAHALASLAFIDQTAKKSANKLNFFNNSVFAIIVISFFTSVFGAWQLIDGIIILRLYETYSVLLFASLHGDTLTQTMEKQALIDKIVYANFIFMGMVVCLLMPIIWAPDIQLEGFYYRFLAANGIVDATLTILAVILHKLYIQKHPETQSTLFSVVANIDANGKPVPVKAEVQRRHIHPLIWLLGIFIFGQMFISILFALFGAFYRS